MYKLDRIDHLQSDLTSSLGRVEAWRTSGKIADSRGGAVAALSREDARTIGLIVRDFQTRGILPKQNSRMRSLSQQAQSALASVLNPAVWAQQEIGSRTDRLGATWEGSSLRGQTNWLREYVGNASQTNAKKDGNLTEKINWSHEQISRLNREIEGAGKRRRLARRNGQPAG